MPSRKERREAAKAAKETQGPETPVVPVTPEVVAEVQSSLTAVMDELGLTPEAKAKITGAAATSGKRARRKSATDIFSAYGHAIEGSLSYDTGANKQRVEIRCQHSGCKKTREVFTSDLFQVRVCLDHKKAQRKSARQDKKAEAKAALAKVEADAKAAEAPKAEEPKPETATA